LLDAAGCFIARIFFAFPEGILSRVRRIEMGEGLFPAGDGVSGFLPGLYSAAERLGIPVTFGDELGSLPG
jgi:hypothetical protein